MSTKAGTKAVADKKRGSQKPKPAGIPEAAPEESKASEIETSGVETVGVETAAENAVSGDARDGDAAETTPGNDVNGAGNPASTGDPVRPLTEAGKKRLVNKLLGLADSQATQGAFKITPADLIRLMQLHREMNPQKNRKVTVQWIEDKAE